MAKRERIRERLRVDLRDEYYGSFFANWIGRDLSAQHRFIPSPHYNAVRLNFTHPQEQTEAGLVIESTDGGETWSEVPGWHPPADRGLFQASKYQIAIQGGVRAWRSTDAGKHWQMHRIDNSEELQYDGLGAPNCFSAIMLTKGIWAPRIVMVSSYFLGQEGPDCEIISSTYSDDIGATWHTSRLFGPPRPLYHVAEGFGEPAVVQMPGGWLWMVFRSEYGELWQTVSMDGGATWGRPSPTGFVAPIANCYAAREPSTGATVLCWNATQPGLSQDFHDKHSLYRPRTNLVFAVSRDNTRTWTVPTVVETEGGQYPTIHFAAGRMFIMYQSSPADESVDWSQMGLTLVAYDTEDVLRLPAWTPQTIRPWIDAGLIRHWRAMACLPENRETIS